MELKYVLNIAVGGTGSLPQGKSFRSALIKIIPTLDVAVGTFVSVSNIGNASNPVLAGSMMPATELVDLDVSSQMVFSCSAGNGATILFYE